MPNPRIGFVQQHEVMASCVPYTCSWAALRTVLISTQAFRHAVCMRCLGKQGQLIPTEQPVVKG